MPLTWRTETGAGGTQERSESAPRDGRRKQPGQALGRLYVVATPIGNLEDVTLRAIKILRRADLIAAENVRHTRGLCRRYGIRTRVCSYRRSNQKRRAPEIIGTLQGGSAVALVTDAGTPGISDPGTFLIARAAEAEIPITPVPGPSAVGAALSVCGFASEAFVFAGFLPPRRGARQRALKALADEPRTLVFFEAPHRLCDMLVDVKEGLGDRPMVMLREMTKAFEEIRRGRVTELLRDLDPQGVRGEITLVVAGAESAGRPRELSQAGLRRLERLLARQTLSVRDVARRVAEQEGLPYRLVYRACLAIKQAEKVS